MGVDCCLYTNMIRLMMMVTALAAFTHSLSMSFTEVTSVTYSKVTRDATCDITVEYSGSDIVQSGSSVSCSIGWPTKKDLDKNVVINVMVGDVLGEIILAKVSFNLFKKK